MADDMKKREAETFRCQYVDRTYSLNDAKGLFLSLVYVLTSAT